MRFNSVKDYGDEMDKINAKRFIIIFLICILIFAVLFRSCGGKSRLIRPRYTISHDISNFAFPFSGRDRNVQAFSDELIEEIGKQEGFIPHFVLTGNHQVFEDLDYGLCEAALTDIMPNVVNQERYAFTDIYYPLGLVILVAKNSHVTDIKELENQTIGIRSGSSAFFKIDQTLSFLIVTYDNINTALDELSNGKIDGVIMDGWSAYLSANGFYSGKVRVLTKPLTQEGLRLITRNDLVGRTLIESFNTGLKKIKENGEYHELLQRWGLYDMENPSANEERIQKPVDSSQ